MVSHPKVVATLHFIHLNRKVLNLYYCKLKKGHSHTGCKPNTGFTITPVN